jgi:DNA-binding CsgD family transcriptional regulator
MPLLYGNMDLTSKEWAITALVFQGLTNAQIATAIQIKDQAVQSSLQTILDKTGCWNRTELALWYLKMGVENERRFRDRREASREINDERRQADRRHIPERASRATEQRRQVNPEE